MIKVSCLVHVCGLGVEPSSADMSAKIRYSTAIPVLLKKNLGFSTVLNSGVNNLAKIYCKERSRCVAVRPNILSVYWSEAELFRSRDSSGHLRSGCTL